jgi:hypothetical protein
LIGDVDQAVGLLMLLSCRGSVDVTTGSGQQQHADNRTNSNLFDTHL